MTNPIEAGFGGQISEWPKTGDVFDSLFAEHYAVKGCPHAHVGEREAEECQDGKCPQATEYLHEAAPELLGAAVELIASLEDGLAEHNLATIKLRAAIKAATGGRET